MKTHEWKIKCVMISDNATEKEAQSINSEKNEVKTKVVEMNPNFLYTN